MIKMKVLKIVLSILLTTHVLIVAMIPNQHSIVNVSLSQYLLPYVNTLGINSMWQFFAPNPGPAIYFEFEVPEKVAGTDEVAPTYTEFYPALKNPYFFRARYNRYISAVRLISRYPKLIKHALAPNICNSYPQLQELSLGFVAMNFPSLEDVRAGESLNSLASREFNHVGSFLCDADPIVDGIEEEWSVSENVSQLDSN